MNVLCLAAHSDDAEMGCGGTLARWAGEGHRVNVMVLTESGYRDENGQQVRGNDGIGVEEKAAAEVLGVKLHGEHRRFPVFGLANDDALRREILKALKHFEIDTVLCHWTGDAHADHAALGAAGLMAARHVPRFLMYRSNWYDGLRPFNANMYFDISRTFPRKVEAVRQYRTEFARAGEQWTRYMESRGSLDGLKVGVRYAEGFEAVRYQA